jgi:hypothetical protein
MAPDLGTLNLTETRCEQQFSVADSSRLDRILLKQGVDNRVLRHTLYAHLYLT